MEPLQLSDENPINPDRLEQLRKVAGLGPVLILTHDNPDPDALASGKALHILLRQVWDIPSRLIYSGLIARAENMAVLHNLTPEWECIDVLENLESYSALVLVDTQPRSGNNSLPPEVIPDIVIDHHLPIRDGLDLVPFVDVRPDVGATASLIYQYFEAAGITPKPHLATAIFYAIQTDTRGLSRGDSPIDRAVYFKLLNLIDRRELSRVEQAGLPRDYYRAYCNGLQAAKVHGRVITAYLGEMHRPDFMAEMADSLVRLDGIRAVLCQGHHGGMMYLSMRTVSLGDDAGTLIQHVVIPPGKAGGHGSSAGGQVPLGNQEPVSVAAQVEGRFLDVLGASEDEEPLL
jgi:nanoRNase/pAp phosphatase (c-di-AMP/oligoRNAs hydrolase)